MRRRMFSWQLLRFGMVGVGTNMLLYLTYLVLVGLGLQYQLAMTASYVGGVVLGYTAQRQWTFRYRGPGAESAVRYLIAYAGGYLLNLIGLYVLVEHARAGAAVAQGVMIFVVAIGLYLAQRHWVFRHGHHQARGDAAESGRSALVESDSR